MFYTCTDYCGKCGNGPLRDLDCGPRQHDGGQVGHARERQLDRRVPQLGRLTFDKANFLNHGCQSCDILQQSDGTVGAAVCRDA
jgi:hypothetical protein